MKIIKKLTPLSLFIFIMAFSFLTPSINAQEWVYNDAETERIPYHSVYPSEWYVFNTTLWGVPKDSLSIMQITKANVSDYMGSKGLYVWGNATYKNMTSGELRVLGHDLPWSFWNDTYGFDGLGFIVALENNITISTNTLNNLSVIWSDLLSVNNFENHRIYYNSYSMAFWNTSTNAYIKFNWTSDGIFYKHESNLLNIENGTLVSRPAQLSPVFNITTEDAKLVVNKTDLKLDITISDADNNNDGVVDTDYLFRILEGSTWTDWATIPSLIDYDLGDVPAGNYEITIQVKNMYGITQEEISIEYTTDVVPGYSPVVIFLMVFLCIVIMGYVYQKKK